MSLPNRLLNVKKEASSLKMLQTVDKVVLELTAQAPLFFFVGSFANIR